ncbi:hypothetical protein [Halobaculum sp. P14]
MNRFPVDAGKNALRFCFTPVPPQPLFWNFVFHGSGMYGATCSNVSA